MKKRISILMFAALLCGVVTMNAQKPFAGIIQYATSIEGTDDANLIASVAGITTEYKVMGNNMKKVVNQQGAGFISITNGDYNIIYTIIDISAFNMGKYYEETKGDELKEMFATKKFDYEYTKESKEVAGYTCYKVNATITDLETDDETKCFFWVTNDLNVGENINFATAPGLKGFPLVSSQDVTTDEGTYTVVQTATLVKPDKKIKAGEFFRPSDAVTFDEMPADVKAALGITDDDKEE